MAVCHPHNLSSVAAAESRPYGIRVRLKPGNTFRRLLGDDWQRLHWYASAVARDDALEDMSRHHEVYRIGDNPDLLFEKVEKLGESRGR